MGAIQITRGTYLFRRHDLLVGLALAAQQPVQLQQHFPLALEEGCK